jgi:hypothetical protein
MAVAMTVNLVSDVNWATSVFSDGHLAFLLRFEVPDRMVVFGVFEQFFGCHRRHGRQLTMGELAMES